MANLNGTDLTADVLRYPDELCDAYVFDLDGTVYLADDSLPGARRLITELRRRGIPVRFLSNNPTKDPQQYATKLNTLGLPTDVSEIINTVVVMTKWLQRNHPEAVLFPVSEQPLKNALIQAGFTLSENPEEIDIVIASYDRTFDYRKLQIAFDAIWYHGRAVLVATNPDRFCPLPGGRGEPDCAAIVAAIEACTGTTCVKNVGKPDPAMLTAALRGLDVEVRRTCMVGDRLATDVRMCLDVGALSALVLTGEATAQDVTELASDQAPALVLDRVDRLIPPALWDELGWSEENDEHP